jgi:hypothetical protein
MDLVTKSGVRDGMSGTAEFSRDEKYRFSLTRLWSTERPLCCVIGLNPSKATELILDNTVRRCVNYAKAWEEYGGLLMLNLFAWRSTDPEPMFKLRGVDIIGGEENSYVGLQRRIDFNRPGIVVAAWGVHGGERGFRALEVLRSPEGALHVLGWNKDKSPKHPLRLRADLKPISNRGTASI